MGSQRIGPQLAFRERSFPRAKPGRTRRNLAACSEREALTGMVRLDAATTTAEERAASLTVTTDAKKREPKQCYKQRAPEAYVLKYRCLPEQPNAQWARVSAHPRDCLYGELDVEIRDQTTLVRRSFEFVELTREVLGQHRVLNRELHLPRAGDLTNLVGAHPDAGVEAGPGRNGQNRNIVISKAWRRVSVYDLT